MVLWAQEVQGLSSQAPEVKKLGPERPKRPTIPASPEPSATRNYVEKALEHQDGRAESLG